MSHRSSSLSRYRKCPRQYRLLEDNPAIEETTTAMERGSIVHRAAETMVRVIGAGGTRELAEREAVKVVESLRGEFSGEAMEEAEFFLHRLTRQPFPPKDPQEEWIAEFGFAFDSAWRIIAWDGQGDLPAGTYYHGRVDFLRLNLTTGFVAAWDWKTARRAESPTTLAEGVQLPGYAEAGMAELERRGGEVGDVEIARLYPTIGVRQVYRLTQEDKDGRFRERIDGEIEAISKDTKFEARPDAATCMTCPVKFLCKAYMASSQEFAEPQSPEDALRMYREAEVQEARADQQREFVKAWISAHGPIPMEGGTFLDFKPVEKRQPLKNAKDILRANGWSDAQIADACSLSVTSLDKILDEEDPLWAEVVSVRTESRLAEVKEA